MDLLQNLFERGTLVEDPPNNKSNVFNLLPPKLDFQVAF